MSKISFSGRHFEKDVMLQSIRWYLTYALSYRDIEELMKERGFHVDHSTINRWVYSLFTSTGKGVSSEKEAPR